MQVIVTQADRGSSPPQGGGLRLGPRGVEWDAARDSGHQPDPVAPAYPRRSSAPGSAYPTPARGGSRSRAGRSGSRTRPGRTARGGSSRASIFLRHGSASWVSQTGAIADRYANAQTGPLGGWSIWAAGLLVAIAPPPWRSGPSCSCRSGGPDGRRPGSCSQRTRETKARSEAARATERACGAPSSRRPPGSASRWRSWSAIAWGLITPLFQVPDEAGHFAYVQHIAETGKPPTGGAEIQHFSPEQRRPARRDALEGGPAAQGRAGARDADLPEAPPAGRRHLV